MTRSTVCVSKPGKTAASLSKNQLHLKCFDRESIYFVIASRSLFSRVAIQGDQQEEATTTKPNGTVSIGRRFF